MCVCCCVTSDSWTHLVLEGSPGRQSACIGHHPRVCVCLELHQPNQSLCLSLAAKSLAATHIHRLLTAGVLGASSTGWQRHQHSFRLQSGQHLMGLGTMLVGAVLQ